MLLQERIRGRNCRVLFLKKNPLKAFIAPSIETVDWRENKDLLWQSFTLPFKIQTHLEHFFDLAGLSIASVDLILSNDRFYFLEANTTPSWLDLPPADAREQTAHMAQFLIEATTR